MAEGKFDNPVVAALTGFYDRFRKQEMAARFKASDNFDGKTILITGATSGLGFALATETAKRGGKVIMGCRGKIPEAGNKVREISGNDNVEMMYLDLTRISSIHDFTDTLQQNNIILDVTILNAASAASRARKTESGLDELFLVNYFANFMLVNLLIKKGIIKGNGATQPRIIFITSDTHRGCSAIDYDEFGRYFDYGVSKAISNYSYFKLVLNTFATELSGRLNKERVTVQVNAICPGPVNTNIIREIPFLARIALRAIFAMIFKTPRKAAQPIIYMACSDDFNDRTNEYMHMFISKKMDEKVYDAAEGLKLWQESEKLWKQVDEKAVMIELN
ncbi:MAG: SDR family NAD(P)-dependent oxidoreductase [Bacteroidales bacterium]|nr:SDR family NAD(P)-dependent oxidoreductase [Bacteroidales bacterium]